MDLAQIVNRLSLARSTMIGYPLNLAPVDMGGMRYFLNLLVNNLGDPFQGGCYQVNSFPEEQTALQFFANLFGASGQWWGYCTSCGTESNLQGIAQGLRNLSVTSMVDPLVYASDQAHYSVDKACRLARVQLIKIKSVNHAIDLNDLENEIRPTRPALVVLTAGTTMAGACDDVLGVRSVLRLKAPPKYYVHLDAALFGLLLPFSPGYAENKTVPQVDFSLPIDSLTVSGHKMIGLPIPCGVFLSRRPPPGETVEYIGSDDRTIGGSRSGLAVLALAYALDQLGLKGLHQNAADCLAIARYAEIKLAEAGFNPWRTGPWSNIVVFDRPEEAIARKWQLAVQGSQAHLIAMPHVTRAMIKSFVDDMKQSKVQTKGN